MEIYVNEEPLEFELNEALPLESILNHVETWAEGQNCHVLNYNVITHQNSETKIYSAEDAAATPEIMQIQSDAIQKLEFIVGKSGDLLSEHVIELEAYIEKAGNFLAQSIAANTAISEKEEGDLTEGFDWLRQSFEILTHRYPLKGIDPQALFPQTSTSGINSAKEAYLESLIQIRSCVQTWKKNVFLDVMEQQDLEAYRHLFTSQIEEAMENLENIIQEFTAGNEAGAFAGFESFFEWASFGLAVLGKLNYKPELLTQIHSIIGEIGESLERKDLVTLTDILDFDLKEKLVELSAA